MAFFERFGEKLSNAGKDVAKRTKELADITKLNMQINNEEDNIKSKYLEIGKLYYELHSSDPSEEFTDLCASITDSENKINTIKTEIQAIKGVKKCSKCGAEISLSATFCSVCGNKTVSEDTTDEQSISGEVIETEDENQSIVSSENTEVVEANDEFNNNETFDKDKIDENSETKTSL